MSLCERWKWYTNESNYVSLAIKLVKMCEISSIYLKSDNPITIYIQTIIKWHVNSDASNYKTNCLTFDKQQEFKL